jgi:ABC-type branched-subunit amino acid transport system substrate-binding protein
MHARKLSLVVALIATTSLLTTACGSAKATPDPIVTPTGISIFGTDGIMSNDFGNSVKPAGLINGMSGTAALAPLSKSFTDRLRTIDPKLDNDNYAGQAYDAVVIAALAVQSGRSVDGPTIASYINGVTTTGTECDDVTACLDDIANGMDIAYHGITLTSGLTKAGEPATASFSTLHFGDDNHIDPDKTEYVIAGNPASANTDAGPALAPIHYYGGDALTIGLLLPKSGPLADAGKPILAGAELAVRDINTAGGILGKGVQTEFQDDGSDQGKSVAGAKQLINDGVPVIIGPSSSGGTEAVLPFTTKAHVVLFSPSATAAALSTVKDGGLFFRTAPSDTLQAQAIADVIARSGAQRIFIVARSDTYGIGLEHDVTTELNADGIDSGNVISAEYSAATGADNAGTFAQIASEIGADHADAVLLIGYNEIGGVIASMSAVDLKFNVS